MIMQSKEQYYESIRKSSSSRISDDAGSEKIPEYSSDIYPYATFHPNQQPNLDPTKPYKNIIYESSNTLGKSNKRNGKKYEVKKSHKYPHGTEENDSYTDDSTPRDAHIYQSRLEIGNRFESKYLLLQFKMYENVCIIFYFIC